MMDADGPIIVGSYSNEEEAYWAQHCLDSEGIESYLAFEHHNSLNRFLWIALGGVKVMVAGRDVPLARKLLAEYDAERYEKYKSLNVNCPSCGSGDIARPSVPYFLLALLMILTIGIFALFFRFKNECRECGQKW
jgi:hypothetical protein